MDANELFQKFLKKDDSPGRGKKQCSDCNSYVGVRTKQCACGYEFTPGGKKNKRKDKYDVCDEPTEEDKIYAASIGASKGRIVYAPKGSTNAVINNIDKDSIFDYCNFTVNEGITQGLIYTTKAIKHFIQHQYGYNSEEYEKSVELVDQWYDELIGVDKPSGDEYNVG